MPWYCISRKKLSGPRMSRIRRRGLERLRAPGRSRSSVATSPLRQLLSPISPSRVPGEQLLVDARLVVEALGVARRHQLDEVVEPLVGLGEQHEVVRRLAGRARSIASGSPGATYTSQPRIGLMPRLRAASWNVDRREHVAVLGHRHRRHLQLRRPGRAAPRYGRRRRAARTPCAGAGGRSLALGARRVSVSALLGALRRIASASLPLASARVLSSRVRSCSCESRVASHAHALAGAPAPRDTASDFWLLTSDLQALYSHSIVAGGFELMS